MSRTDYALFDTHYLCHRARWSTGGLKNQDQATGVAFGVLMEIEKTIDLLHPKTCVFAFDYGGPGVRGELFPDYKISRRQEKTEEEQEEQKLFFDQVKVLFKEILPGMGFKNIFKAKGFEGDDIIAKIAMDLPSSSEIVIISGDFDMFQVLAPNIVFRHPNGKVVTSESFRKEYGVLPSDWARVKAIAGCNTDDVPGVMGVGELTAAKYLRGELKKDSKKAIAIESSLDIVARNLPLVTLPFPGTPSFSLEEDELSEEKRREVFSSLGIRTDRRRPKREGLF